MAFLDRFKFTRNGSNKGAFPFPAQQYNNGGIFFLPRSNRNYKKDVGDGLGNSIVVSIVNWAARNFPEAPLVLYERKWPDPAFELCSCKDQNILKLLKKPNPYYNGTTLLTASVVDWNIHGNVYWIKVRSKVGDVVELWWASPLDMMPVGDSETFIKYYEYTPNGDTTNKIRFKPEDIVHFRFLLDPRNPRLGLAPLNSLLREIFTDDEAANFSASLLTNAAVPGVILAPQQMQGAFVSIEEDADRIKRSFQSHFGGDRRGEPMILTAPTDVKTLSWSPEQLNLTKLRRLPEERISAVLGIPAGVVGLGAGLEHNSFSNYRDSREAAYENNIIPTQRSFSATLDEQLIPEFYGKDEAEHQLRFNLDNVRALAEDSTALYNRVRIAVGAGLMMVSEARILLNLPTDDSHHHYLRAPQMIVVPEEEVNNPDFMGNRNVGLNLPPGTTNTSVTDSDVALDDSTLPLPFENADRDEPNEPKP